jgi:large subunit ribosomal protein L24
MYIRKGDNVIVLTGKDKGKKGKVLSVFPDANKVLVEGVNLKKKHQKPRKRGERGQTIDVSHPLDASNVSLIDPKSGKPTRVGYKILAGKKIRIAKKSGVEI